MFVQFQARNCIDCKGGSVMECSSGSGRNKNSANIIISVYAISLH